MASVVLLLWSHLVVFAILILDTCVVAVEPLVCGPDETTVISSAYPIGTRLRVCCRVSVDSSTNYTVIHCRTDGKFFLNTGRMSPCGALIGAVGEIDSVSPDFNFNIASLKKRSTPKPTPSTTTTTTTTTRPTTTTTTVPTTTTTTPPTTTTTATRPTTTTTTAPTMTTTTSPTTTTTTSPTTTTTATTSTSTTTTTTTPEKTTTTTSATTTTTSPSTTKSTSTTTYPTTTTTTTTSPKTTTTTSSPPTTTTKTPPTTTKPKKWSKSGKAEVNTYRYENHSTDNTYALSTRWSNAEHAEMGQCYKGDQTRFNVVLLVAVGLSVLLGITLCAIVAVACCGCYMYRKRRKRNMRIHSAVSTDDVCAPRVPAICFRSEANVSLYE